VHALQRFFELNLKLKSQCFIDLHGYGVRQGQPTGNAFVIFDDEGTRDAAISKHQVYISSCPMFFAVPSGRLFAEPCSGNIHTPLKKYYFWPHVSRSYLGRVRKR